MVLDFVLFITALAAPAALAALAFNAPAEVILS